MEALSIPGTCSLYERTASLSFQVDDGQMTQPRRVMPSPAGRHSSPSAFLAVEFFSSHVSFSFNKTSEIFYRKSVVKKIVKKPPQISKKLANNISNKHC